MKNNSSFQALAWLQTLNQGTAPQEESTPILRPPPFQKHILEANSNAYNELKKAPFCPIDFLIPGWKGDGLLTKSAAQIKNTLFYLWTDSKSIYDTFDQRNRSLKLAVYNEFHNYILCSNDPGLSIIDNYKSFWEHFSDSSSPFRSHLDKFKDLYCYRVATTYLLKVRFLILLADELELNLSVTNILNPSSYISKFFQKGGSTEINCRALQSNQYSWYRPSNYIESDIHKLVKHFKLISITELMKIFTYVELINSESDESSSSIFSKDEDYSHTVSHTSFGLFINQLLLRIPQWLSEGSYPLSRYNESINSKLDVETTKFTGEKVSSLSLSHWLAQQHNQFKKWDSIIYPHFESAKKFDCDYLRLCHELMFISFLVKISKDQGYSNPINLISQVLKDADASLHINNEPQMSLLDNCDNRSSRSYDRIVLNLTSFIKKNPHHYLLTKINEQINEMNPKSSLIVFTNQNLFVPSQSEKVKSLLKSLKLDVSFNLENIKGKGEIANFVYIFSKRKRTVNNSLDSFYQKESCISFQWKGVLTQFNIFHSLIEELDSFLDKKGPSATSIFHKEVNGLSFEYHQDAIVDGKLLSLTSNANGSFTHPNFIKNLTKHSIPFENFFNVNMIDPLKYQAETNEFFGVQKPAASQGDVLLIINFQTPTKIQIELFPASFYRVKYQKYGSAYFQYFFLTPKRKDININTFLEYFKSDLGQQVIQLSLQGKATKLKAKLNSLLVPKFFEQTSRRLLVPENVSDLYKLSCNELTKIKPDSITQRFSDIERFISENMTDNPWQILCTLADLKHKLATSLESLNLNIEECFESENIKTSKIDFKNPVLSAPLARLTTHSIVPKNDEVYLELVKCDPKILHRPLTDSKIVEKDGSFQLNLISDEDTIISLHSHKCVLEFVQFILSHGYGNSISAILQNLRVPKYNDLEKVIEHFQSLPTALFESYKSLNSHIKLVFQNYISNFS